MQILDKLRDNNLKITPQRVAIIKFLEQKTHPNVDEIYESVKRSFVSISLATIYKNLNALKESGLVVEINTQSGKLRYDLNLKSHIHLYCPVCSKIDDLFLDDILIDFNSVMAKKLSLESVQSDILVKSVCKSCNSKQI